MLAAGIGVVFLLFATVILDARAGAVAVTAFYVMGTSSIVIGSAVFLRDFRLELKRRRHVRSKGGRRRGQEWKPRIEVTSRRDAEFDTFFGNDEDK